MKRKLFSIVMVMVLFAAGTGFSKNSVCEVHFLDAGQSDCILIKGETNNYLIDTGAEYYSDSILKYLDKNGVKSVKAVIITHFHDDHYGGLLKICEKLKVDEICLPGHKADAGTSIYKSISAMGIRISYTNNDYILKDGKINLKAIGPLRYDDKNENNNSLVLQGEIQGIKYLFTGDCEREEENDLAALELVKKCQVLKIPHHSLDTSGSESFMRIADPEILIVTCNGADTPDYEMIREYSKYGPVFRSDINGNIVIFSGNECGIGGINIKLIKKI